MAKRNTAPGNIFAIQTAAAARTVALGQEVIRFSMHRLETDQALFRTALVLRNPIAFAQVMNEHIAAGMVDYSAEVRRMAALLFNESADA